MRTAIIFVTSHEADLSKPVDFPPVAETRENMERIQSILDHIICRPEASRFLREVDPSVDIIADVPVDRPMDLGQMRDNFQRGFYQSFTEFVRDLRCVIDNAFQYKWRHNGDKIRRSAAHLSKYIREILESLSQPGRYDERFGDTDALHEAEKKITNARNMHRNLKRQSSGVIHPIGSGPGRIARKNVFEKLCSSKDQRTLRGVVEIITGRAIEKASLPLEVDLDRLNDDVIQRLASCLESSTDTSGFRSAQNSIDKTVWNPELPQDLQEIRRKYRKELEHWLKTPALPPTEH